MNLKILITPNTVEIELINKRTVVDKISLESGRKLSENLLLEIDRLLKKNNAAAADVAAISLKSDIPKSYTAYRIVRAAAQAFGWGISVV